MNARWNLWQIPEILAYCAVVFIVVSRRKMLTALNVEVSNFFQPVSHLQKLHLPSMAY